MKQLKVKVANSLKSLLARLKTQEEKEEVKETVGQEKGENRGQRWWLHVWCAQFSSGLVSIFDLLSEGDVEVEIGTACKNKGCQTVSGWLPHRYLITLVTIYISSSLFSLLTDVLWCRCGANSLQISSGSTNIPRGVRPQYTCLWGNISTLSVTQVLHV